MCNPSMGQPARPPLGLNVPTDGQCQVCECKRKEKKSMWKVKYGNMDG